MELDVNVEFEEVKVEADVFVGTELGELREKDELVVVEVDNRCEVAETEVSPRLPNPSALDKLKDPVYDEVDALAEMDGLLDVTPVPIVDEVAFSEGLRMMDDG